MANVKSQIKKFLKSQGIELSRLDFYGGKPNPERPWEDDDQFVTAWREAARHSLVDLRRAFILYELTRAAALLPGAIAEVGVYRGGTALLMARIKPGGKPLYLFDTFEGMPETDPDKDIHRALDFNDSSLKDVEQLLKPFSNVAFRQGFFPDTASGLEDQTFSLVHVDADIYRSVYDCCSFFYPRLDPGGVMVFDDYGYLTCPGAKEAVRQFSDENNFREVYLQTGQALIWKH